MKNAYVGRTFIQPSQTIRQLGIRLKLNPLRDVIAGKRLVVVDDSIVRGNTQRALVRMLREAGAAEVHVRIASPPVRWPCFYGIDFATRAELIAHRPARSRRSATSIGADSLGYVSLDGLVAATEQARRTAVPRVLRRRVPDRRAGPGCGKHLLEGTTSRWQRDGQPTAIAGSYAAAGVDIEAGERAVELMKARDRRRPMRPRWSAVSVGSRGCSTPRRCTRYRGPLLATSTDGVGTKIAIAQAMDVHDTIGIDLVGMVVDDLVVCGAEPLFMTDYIACGKVVPERIAAIVAGIAEGCVPRRVRAGGRGDRRAPRAAWPPTSTTWPAPGPAWSRPTTCSAPTGSAPGDVVVAMASSGLHSNGYSLVRHVLLDQRRMAAGRARAGVRPHPRRGAARADPHLRPGLPGPDRRRGGVHALSHITGRRARRQRRAGPARRNARGDRRGPPGRRRRSSP